MRCPCKDCGKRFPACHSSCDGYQAWRTEQDRIKEQNHHEYISMSKYLEYCIKRNMKRKG